MAVTTTRFTSCKSLATELHRLYPHLAFVPGDDFRWSPREQSVYYRRGARRQDTLALLLHETGHAVCEHTDYSLDIELIRLERQAWHVAQTTLGSRLGIRIDDELIEASMDTYRDWLHARSTCPDCSATGIQDAHKNTYSCMNCRCSWSVNDARRCGLKRTRVVS